jgi:uncharacterized protein with PIN domain
MAAEDELRARLKAEIEEEIERLARETQGRGGMTLREIEEAVRGAGRRIEQRLMEGMLGGVAKEARQEREKCSECGGELRYKGQKERWVATTSGEVRIERGYYYCEACGRGVFPPGSEVGVDGEPV